MGVKCLLLHRLPKGAIPTNTDAEKLIAALDKLCAVPANKRNPNDKRIEGTLYIMKQTPPRDPQLVSEPQFLHDVWMMQLAENADRLYLLRRHPRQVVEVDGQTRHFLEKELGYKSRSTIVVQARTWYVGDRHSDISVKLLQIGALGQLPSALALEVHYSPVRYLDKGQAVLQEFANAIKQSVPEGLSGSLEVLPPTYTDYQEFLPDEFSPHHTAVAYADLVTAVLSSNRAA
eukprot:jgi/Chrzof1/1364/Cz10g04170.t1